MSWKGLKYKGTELLTSKEWNTMIDALDELHDYLMKNIGVNYFTADLELGLNNEWGSWIAVGPGQGKGLIVDLLMISFLGNLQSDEVVEVHIKIVYDDDSIQHIKVQHSDTTPSVTVRSDCESVECICFDDTVDGESAITYYTSKPYFPNSFGCFYLFHRHFRKEDYDTETLADGTQKALLLPHYVKELWFRGRTNMSSTNIVYSILLLTQIM